MMESYEFLYCNVKSVYFYGFLLYYVDYEERRNDK